MSGWAGCPDVKKNVLIVEDNPLLALNCVLLVEDTLGCSALQSASSDQACRLMTDRIDLALLDIEVADGVTFPLAYRLRECGIPFIFMSASDPAKVPLDLSDARFLRKPVLPTELIEAARQYL